MKRLRKKRREKVQEVAENNRSPAVALALMLGALVAFVVALMVILPGDGQSGAQRFLDAQKKFADAKAALDACVAQGAACTSAMRDDLGRQLALAEVQFNQHVGTSGRKGNYMGREQYR
jgi:hypothetical protein